MGGDGHARALPRLVEALLVAAVSPVLPGIAHLRAGRVGPGRLMLFAQALALTAAALAARRGPVSPAALDGRPGPLFALAAGGVLVAVLWTLLIVRSYAVLVPAGLPPRLRIAGGAGVCLLCLLAAVPPLAVARYGVVQRELVWMPAAAGPRPGCADDQFSGSG
ncbi:hypothetical protein [Actinomadura fibrosa]|uniref:Uncharacterized protein n=1 Tax=Actinomadura fibrosa TaxID=111802 RepID=A0ABW2XUT3_9ACTN|nr:hypothetical protein [Actinomadura fibrosa]